MNLKRIQATLFFGLVGISFLSYAQTLESMDAKQLQQLLINKTLTSIPVDNLNGKDIANTFSFVFDGHGHALGKLAIKPQGEPQIDKGHYEIKEDGTVYLTWQHWDGAKQLCAHFFDTQNAYLAIDCSNVFHTVFMKTAIKPGNAILGAVDN